MGAFIQNQILGMLGIDSKLKAEEVKKLIV